MPRRQKPTLEEAFGSLLRSLREDQELSQEGLGNESGSGRTYISELERGVKNPSLRTVFRLSRHLGVKPSEIVKRLERKLGPIEDIDLD